MYYKVIPTKKSVTIKLGENNFKKFIKTHKTTKINQI